MREIKEGMKGMLESEGTLLGLKSIPSLRLRGRARVGRSGY